MANQIFKLEQFIMDLLLTLISPGFENRDKIYEKLAVIGFDCYLRYSGERSIANTTLNYLYGKKVVIIHMAIYIIILFLFCLFSECISYFARKFQSQTSEIFSDAC